MYLIVFTLSFAINVCQTLSSNRQRTNPDDDDSDFTSSGRVFLCSAVFVECAITVSGMAIRSGCA